MILFSQDQNFFVATKLEKKDNSQKSIYCIIK
jgi:hypothetical protein